jgi:hypothetical protein
LADARAANDGAAIMPSAVVPINWRRFITILDNGSMECDGQVRFWNPMQSKAHILL